MWAIWKKELGQYFSSLTAYIAMAVFLLLSGLFLFVFPDTNLLDYGYATLEKFFELAPWILLLLVPAITMRSFADEFKAGTFEVLRTSPVTSWQVILGKYFGSLVVILCALLPTVIYIYTIQQLAPQAGIDVGGTAGSYLGLIFLVAVFTAIGICCSSFSNNAVVAFLIGAFVCFLMYNAFNAISRIPAFSAGADYYIEMFGIDFHYRSLSRGVVDTRDLIYFLSLIFGFLFITNRNLEKR